MNIFDNEELFKVTKVDLNSFIDDNEDFENFFDRFINNEPISNPLEAIFRFFKSNSNGSLFEGDDGSHFLLVISTDFLRKHRPKRKGIRTFIKDSLSKLADKISQHTPCTIITTGRESGVNTDILESFLDLNRLKREIDLKSNEALIVEFLNFNYSDIDSGEDIVIKSSSKEIVLKSGSSVIIGNRDFYKIKSKKDSFIKFTYEEDRILVNLYGIDSIKSNNSYLVEEYLYDGEDSYEEIDIYINELDGYISFDGLKVELSKKTNQSKDIDILSKDKSEIDGIKSDTFEEPKYPKKDSVLDLRKSFIVYLKSFFVPFSSGLSKVYYNLDLIDKKFILVAGNKSLPDEKRVAQIVVDAENKTIKVVNRSNHNLSFQYGLDGLKMVANLNFEATNTDIGSETDSIDTDPASGQNSKIVVIEPNQEEIFKDSEIDFNDSSIKVDNNGVKTIYYNFVIGSFGKDEIFNLGRNSFRFFEHGTIIDNNSNNSYGGREYKDGNYKIAGNLISRTPADIYINGQEVVFKNSIKSEFNLFVNTLKGEYKIPFGNSKTLSTHELFADTNVVAISRGESKILEISLGINL